MSGIEERRVGERRTDLIEAIDAVRSDIARVAAAFPHDDPDAHRRYHEAVIRKTEEREQLFKKLRFELTKHGLIWFIGWLLYVAWIQFLRGPK